jgi:hypothetical protein
MHPDPRFTGQPPSFWALVKLASEGLGYSDRRVGTTPGNLRRHASADIAAFLARVGWEATEAEIEAAATYIAFRANLLESDVRPALMDKEQAATEYANLFASAPEWKSYQPLNKQGRGGTNYLNAMVNLVVERELEGQDFNSNPRALIVITDGPRLRHVLPRQMDGAYPAVVNPEAVWEVKEYYGTTTFGSRVADGVYETRLDGTELELLRDEGYPTRNYLMADDYFTWWDCGRSYLCRIIDMLHEGLLTAVFFGRQVLTEWPDEVRRFRLPAE